MATILIAGGYPSIQRHLESLDYTVDEAQDIGEAWQKLETATYDLVIADEVAFVGDEISGWLGVELIRLMESWEITTPIPVILGVAMCADRDNYQHCLDVYRIRSTGKIRFLIKPYDFVRVLPSLANDLIESNTTDEFICPTGIGFSKRRDTVSAKQ